MNDLLGLMVLYTPNDPVAGNPSSLMDNFVRLDFSPVLVDLPLGPPMGGGMGNVVSQSKHQMPTVEWVRNPLRYLQDP